MARPKGLEKTGGRKMGSPNKLSADLKAMILGALDASGHKTPQAARLEQIEVQMNLKTP